MPWLTPATTRGRCRPGSAIATSSTPCATPNLRRTGSRISGVRFAPRMTPLRPIVGPIQNISGLPQGPAPALVVRWWRCRSATWGKHMPHGRFNRRDLIRGLAVAAATWPLAARAQQPGKIPRIGIIDDSLHWNAFRHGLRDLGYLEGQNIAFDYAYGDGVPERLAEAAAALVRRPVD